MVTQIYAIIMVLPAIFSYRSSASQETDMQWFYTEVVANIQKVPQTDLDAFLIEAIPATPEKLPALSRYFESEFMLEKFHSGKVNYQREVSISLSPFYININAGDFEVIPHPEVVNFSQPAGGIFARYKLVSQTDPARKFSAGFNTEVGKFSRGGLTAFRTTVSAKPISKLNLTANLEWNDVGELGYEKISGDAILYSFDGKLAFNPRLQLAGKYQLSDLYETSIYKIRFSYEFQSQSFFSVVVNNDGYPDGNEKLKARSIFINFSFRKQF